MISFSDMMNFDRLSKTANGKIPNSAFASAPALVGDPSGGDAVVHSLVNVTPKVVMPSSVGVSVTSSSGAFVSSSVSTHSSVTRVEWVCQTPQLV